MPRPKSKDQKNVKSERISIIVKPKTKDRITKIAYMQQNSTNNLIQEILDNYTEKHTKEVKQYDLLQENDSQD